MNLFQNILNKSTQFGQNFSLQGVAKLGQKMEDKFQLSEKAFNYAQPEAQDPIQRFFDDTNQPMEKKQALMDNLKSGVPKTVLQSYITEKYYAPKEFSQMYGSTAPLFPRSKDDSPVEGVLKTIGNLPTSGLNLLQGTMNIGRTAQEQGIGETLNMMGRGIVKSIGQGGQAVQTGYEQGGTLGAINTALEGTNKYLTENPAEILAPTAIKPLGSLVKQGGKTIMQGAEVVAPKMVEFGRQTGRQISKVGEDVKNMYSESISGLNKSEQAGMQSNPYQQKDFAEMVQRTKAPEGIDDIKNYQTEQYGKVTESVTKTLDDMQKNFSEDGKVYQEIKSLPTRVQSRPILSSIESHPLLAMDETGRIVRKPGIESGTITDSDISHINRLYQDIRASVESGNGTLSVEQLLKSRSTASKYARYDKMDVNTLSADGARIMRDIRSSLDRVAKEQVQGLKELDSLYVDKMTELNDALRDLIYKGGDVKGEYRSNLGSIISNLANPSRANLLARLEQIMPGIGQKVESIRNLATLHKTMNDKGIFARYSGAGGAVVGATTLGTAFPVVGHIVGFFGGGLLGRLIEGGVTKGKVRILEKILSKETPARQAEIGKIAKAVEEGKKLDAQGKKIIEEIKAKIIYEKARATVQPDDNKLLLPAPSGKATGAKNFRVNQQFEKNPEPSIIGKQEGKRVIVKTPESQKLLTAPKLPKGTSYPRTDVSAQSMQGLSSNVKRPNGSTSNNNPVSTRAGTVRQKVTPQKTIVKPKGQTPAGPTTFNTSGKRVIKKAPESPVALERGYTTSVKKPIVKGASNNTEGAIKSYKGEQGNIKDILNTKFSDKVETLDIYENESSIFLNRIKVKDQGKGIGTSILEELKKYADKTGKRIELTPEKISNTSKEKLTQWYKNNGFVENKGRNKDFSTREAMYYSPKK